MKKLNGVLCIALVATMAFVTIFVGPVYALPSLQLGPGDDGSTWYYDNETWFVEGSEFSLNAYANALGGNGDYAWAEGDPLVAYLVVSAVPMMGDATDVFNVTVSNSSFYSSGFGTPPISDSNALAPHGIYDTYFEIYEFVFDGPVGTIGDTQPGETDTGDGYTETFDIDIDLLADGVTGVHFDLFTMTDPEGQLIAFAPFSHDAETAPVPEPATMLLLGVGLMGIAGLGRKKLIKKQ